MKWRLTVLVLAGTLIACASEQPLGTDQVKDEATAIRLGKAVCYGNDHPKEREGGNWSAELSKGQWKVWEGRDRSCPATGATVSAADGSASCQMCVKHY